MATRQDLFDDSSYSTWWQDYFSVNAAVSFGEGSPVANAIAISYSTDPEDANWLAKKIQSKFTMPGTGDITVRATYQVTGGDTAGYGHAVYIGILSVPDDKQYLVACVRAAGGGVRMFTFAGASSDVNNPALWDDRGGFDTEYNDAMLDVFYDQSGSTVKYSMRSDALVWTEHVTTGSIILGATNRAVMYLDAFWTHDSSGSYPVVAAVDSIWLQADSFSDITAPTVSTIAVDAAGTTLTIVMDEPVTGTPSGFSITAGGSAVALSSGAIASDTITYDIDDTIGVGQTVLLTYTGSDIVDAAANALVEFADAAVTNNSTQDISPPSVNSLTVDAAGTKVTIVLNETITGTPSGFTMKADGASISLSSGAIDDDEITYTTEQITSGQTVTLSYTGSDIEDGSGNPLAAFTDSAVVNNSTYTPPSPTVSSVIKTFRCRWGSIGYRRR